MCLKHGQGSDKFANGDSYVGEYRHGKPHGEGQYIWADGAIYTGSFKEGFKHGQGRWRSDRQTVTNSYEGDYANDVKEGYG
jgi:hypothetical protein